MNAVSIWLVGSLLPCCDVMSLLVLLISLPLPRYLCLTTALLCVIALSAVAVWLPPGGTSIFFCLKSLHEIAIFCRRKGGSAF